jgi:carboxymethylenebutenolidase
VAPDLLSGMGPGGGRSSSFADVNATREAVSMLPPAQVTADLNAVADYGKTIPAANGKLYVVGFCWGGTQSFGFATNRQDLSAAFVFYGTPPPEGDMARIKAPVSGFYGGNDARVTSTVDDTAKQMKKHGKKYESVVYEGAGHGFMRAGEMPDAASDNKSAMEKGWARMLEILRTGK